jgi:glycosyltransferase involved in cell wall biosynthesis
MSEEGRVPKVSVGLAVFNGEQYLEAAVDSILGQTFKDLELILSDNASTDRTEEICRRHAARDSRVRYVRNARNIGGANNENQTFRLARAPLFRWAAHDDLMEKQALERCVAVMDAHTEVTLCYTGVVVIDEHGTEHERFLPGKALDASPSRRFFDLYTLSHNCETSYGLMRSAVLRRTDLQLNYTDSDRTLLAELALHGPFWQVPEYLFRKRYHPRMSTSQFSDWRARMAWFAPEGHDRRLSPYWLQFLHYLRIIRRVPLPLHERLSCLGLMVWWAARYRRWWAMFRDLPQLPASFAWRDPAAGAGPGR